MTEDIVEVVVTRTYKTRPCRLDGCGGRTGAPGTGHGLCSKHYTRLKRNQPLEGRTQREKPTAERFWEKVASRPRRADACWLWTGATNSKGYGQFRISPSDNTPRKAHRWAWEEVRGPIPPGLELDHVVCGVTSCVRPSHMQIVTKSENVRRARKARPRPTHCKRGHAFDADNTRVSKRGHWSCRSCEHDAYVARRRLSPRAAAAPGTLDA